MLILLFIPLAVEADEVVLDVTHATSTYIGTSTDATFTVDMQTFDVSLNVFEIGIQFDPFTHIISDIEFTSMLCEEKFIIEESYDTSSGVYYLACGTSTPFTTKISSTLLDIKYQSSNPFITPSLLPTKTSFYQHDGLGTQATWVNISKDS